MNAPALTIESCRSRIDGLLSARRDIEEAMASNQLGITQARQVIRERESELRRLTREHADNVADESDAWRQLQELMKRVKS
jgi:chromosome segregation ATPase